MLATAAALVSLLGADPATLDPRLDPPNALAVVATTVAGLSLIWRRSRPTASYAVYVTGCLVVSLSGHYIGLLSVLLLVALYSLATHAPRRTGVIGLAATVAVFVVLALLDVPDLGTGDLLQAVALLLAAWAVGDAVRSRRDQQRDELRAAEQEAVAAREQAALAASDERLRIARELHDVVAHSMSLIAVQAGVGAHVIRDDPDAAARALDVIAETAARPSTRRGRSSGCSARTANGPPARRYVGSTTSRRWSTTSAARAWRYGSCAPGRRTTSTPRSPWRPTGSSRSR